MIDIQNLTRIYDGRAAVDDVSLTVEPGQIAALVGTSGSGKTTLLRMINRLVEPSSGRVLIDGQDMQNVPANRRPTNMVFQSYAIFPHLTVAENVGFGLRRDPRSRTEKAAAVEEALAMVGLAGYGCLLYTSPSPRDLSTSRMPSSA